MAKRARMRFPRPLSELLVESLQGKVMAERLREADIWRIWPEVVGPVVASRAQPVRIINGTLTVAVSSGPWMQELTFLKAIMQQKLNDRLEGNVVREIILKSGRIPRPAADAEDDAPRRKKLDKAQLGRIEQESAAIADEETRLAFAELMKASLETVRPRK